MMMAAAVELIYGLIITGRLHLFEQGEGGAGGYWSRGGSLKDLKLEETSGSPGLCWLTFYTHIGRIFFCLFLWKVLTLGSHASCHLGESKDRIACGRARLPWHRNKQRLVFISGRTRTNGPFRSLRFPRIISNIFVFCVYLLYSPRRRPSLKIGATVGCYKRVSAIASRLLNVVVICKTLCNASRSACYIWNALTYFIFFSFFLWFRVIFIHAIIWRVACIFPFTLAWCVRLVRPCGFVPDGHHSHFTRRLSPRRWRRKGIYIYILSLACVTGALRLDSSRHICLFYKKQIFFFLSF